MATEAQVSAVAGTGKDPEDVHPGLAQMLCQSRHRISLEVSHDDVPLIAAALMVSCQLSRTEEEKTTLLGYASKLTSRLVVDLAKRESGASG